MSVVALDDDTESKPGLPDLDRDAILITHSTPPVASSVVPRARCGLLRGEPAAVARRTASGHAGRHHRHSNLLLVESGSIEVQRADRRSQIPIGETIRNQCVSGAARVREIRTLRRANALRGSATKRMGQSAASIILRVSSIPNPGASLGTSLPFSGNAIPGTLRKPSIKSTPGAVPTKNSPQRLPGRA